MIYFYLIFFYFRSIHIIIQKRPGLLEKDFRYFFIEYNDPIYVKLEKIDILYKLSDDKNFEFILNELKSYAIMEFDQEIITKAFKYMGAITYKFPKACELCVKCLQDIYQHGEAFIINQAIIVTRDLLRKYKNTKSFEILKLINMDFAKKINLPESKSALLYIIGEFALEIDSSVEILNWFAGNFPNENEKVKAQILNSAIKNFVNKPNISEEITKYILQKAGEECENPDIRDRAYIYWRLLENDPDSAKEMLMGEKPAFVYVDYVSFEKNLLEDLVENLTNISCLYQKNSKELIPQEDLVIENIEEEENSSAILKTEENSISNEKEMKKKKKNKILESKINTNDFDLLGLGESSTSTVNNKNYNLNIPVNLDIMDLFGMATQENKNIDTNNINLGNTNNNSNNLFEIGGNNLLVNNNDMFSDIQFLDENENTENNIFSKALGVTQPNSYKAFDKNSRGKNGVCGLSVSGLFHRENQNLLLGLNIRNDFSLMMNNFSFGINKNIFGINILYDSKYNNIIQELYLNSENFKNVILNLTIDKNNFINLPNNPEETIKSPLFLDIVIKNNLDDFYFNIPLYLNTINLENGKMNNQNFIEFFKKFSINKTTVNYSNDLRNDVFNEDSLTKLLEKNNIFVVAKNNKMDPPVFYFSGLLELNLPYILEISFIKGILFLKFFYFYYRSAERDITEDCYWIFMDCTFVERYYIYNF